MVFFVCNSCQETLKGKALDAHSGRCSGSLSCVDCSADFDARSARQHNACMTEAQKYQGSTYKAPKKKADPQALWLEQIGVAAEKPSRHAATLRRTADFPNVPRKLKPFLNFMRSSLRMHNEAGASVP